MRVACALALAVGAGPAGAAQAGVVRVGRAPVLQSGAVVVGQVAPEARLHVTVVLKPRDPAALAAYAQAVSTPGSSDFRRYLTTAQFARRFGATAAAIGTVRRSLRAQGLKTGPVTAGGLSIRVLATAGHLERGLRISLRRLVLPDRRTAIMANAAPALGAHAADAVEAVIGLDSVSAPHPLLHRRAQNALRAPGAIERAHATVATGGPQPCKTARAQAGSQGSYTADQIAAAYGFGGLYRAGDRGGGVTVAIYELEPVDPRDVNAYQSCYGTHASVRYVRVDGGAGSGPGTGEAALDVENLIGLAPRANVLVYEGKNSSSGAPGAGPFDTFSAIINQDRAKVVSVSWGVCEAVLGAANAGAENTLFEQAAVQGQTIVAASGDNGSEDCVSGSRINQTQLAVDDPASQPFVTSVGGTTLSAIGPPPVQSVWNTGTGPLGARTGAGASGGGISDLWQMPSGQRDASSAVNVLGAGATGSQCGHPGGYCREVPDVAADADPMTGYTVYWNGSGNDLAAPEGWQAIGGTSGAAPVWAALMALADGSPACAAGPIGYALPSLYRAASSTYAADFSDVASGNNDFTGTNRGLFAAAAGYDEATGLGTPNATALASDLCGGVVQMTKPHAHRSALGASVRMMLHARAADGGRVRFHTTGLPPGLSINAITGAIAGRPRRMGIYHVTATARDRTGALAGARFTWSVGAAPRIENVSLSGIGARRPALSFTIVTGHGSPPMRELALSVPTPLKVTSSHAIRVSVRGTARFTANAVDGKLRIELRRAFRRVRITVAYPSLQTTGGRLANARGRQAPRLALAVLDAGHGASRLQARI